MRNVAAILFTGGLGFLLLVIVLAPAALLLKLDRFRIL